MPAFFFYMSQQIASQMSKITDLAFVQSNCLELSGNLANFDMVTIYQTILNSAQTGELSVVDEAKEAVATFFFEEGQTKHGRYYHLAGEEAFWQLFLHEKLSGTFSFSIVEPGTDEAPDEMPIRRNPTDLLITALQYRDEFKGMMDDIPDPARPLRREKLNLDWPDEHADLRPVAEAVWQTCYSSVISLEELCQRLPYCEIRFFKTILVLLETGHFSLLENDQPADVAV